MDYGNNLHTRVILRIILEIWCIMYQETLGRLMRGTVSLLDICINEEP